MELEDFWKKIRIPETNKYIIVSKYLQASKKTILSPIQALFYAMRSDTFLQSNQKGVVIQTTDRDVGTPETSRLVIPAQGKRKE